MAYKNEEENRIKVCKAYQELKNYSFEEIQEILILKSEYDNKLQQLKKDLKIRFPTTYPYLGRSLEFDPRRFESVCKFLINQKTSSGFGLKGGKKEND